MIYTNFRAIDSMGRIVIAKDIRKHFDIKPGDCLHIEADDECITIKKAENRCIFCRSAEDLVEYSGKFVCRECLNKLSER